MVPKKTELIVKKGAVTLPPHSLTIVHIDAQLDEMEIGGKDVIFSLGYSKTDELGGVLPESRIAAVVGVGILEEVGLTFEYAHDEDYDVSEGGTGEGADAITVQLAYEF